MKKVKCDLCGELGDQADIQAFYDVENGELVDVGECCGSPEGAILYEKVLEENRMTEKGFEEEYGRPQTEWVFNLPEGLDEG